jgi:predicted RNA-binding Zn-ribbon protein involved in translation (DUF1610 family)
LVHHVKEVKYIIPNILEFDMKPPWTRSDKNEKLKQRFKKRVSDVLRQEWDVNNVVELDDKRKIWRNFRALCTNCLHNWVAVATETNNLECPQCGHLTGGEIERKEL